MKSKREKPNWFFPFVFSVAFLAIDLHALRIEQRHGHSCISFLYNITLRRQKNRRDAPLRVSRLNFLEIIRFVLIVCNGSVFCDGSVGAVDGVFAGAIVPTTAFFNGVPLCYGAFKGDTRKVVARPEHHKADTRNTIGNRYARKVVAIRERVIADTRNTIGNRYTRKLVAIRERFIADTRNTIGNRYARKVVARKERVIADGSNRVGNYKTCILFASCIRNKYCAVV